MKLVRQLKLFLMDLDLSVHLLYGEEAMNQGSVFHLELWVDPGINTDLWLGLSADLRVILADGSLIQKTLVVTSVSSGDLQKNHQALVSLMLESPLGLLRYSSKPRVFLHQNKLTVMKQVLIEHTIFKPEQCHFHLSKQYPTVPMIIQFYHESNLDFLQRLLAEERLFYWLADDGIHLSDQVLFCPRTFTDYTYNPDEGLIYRFWSEQMAKKTVFHANSYLAIMHPGQCIMIDKEEYIITSIKHYIKPAHQLNDQALPYWNHMSLQSRLGAKLVPKKPRVRIPWCFQATIESPNEHAHLDDQGRYRVKFFFDQATDGVGEHSAFIPRLQYYGGLKQGVDPVGMHFPLYDGTEVLINCIDGDLYQPIILGALANSDHPSVVKHLDPNRNVMTTANACGFVLDDAQERSIFSVPGHSLSLDQKKQTLALLAEQGDIQCYSKQDTALRQGGDATMQVNGECTVVADQVAELVQVNQDLSLQSAHDFHASSGDSFMMQAKDMQFNALDQLLVSAASVKQLLQQGKQVWEVKNKLVMKSKKIQIKSERLIVLSCMNSAIEITPDKISFFSKAIEIDAGECRVQANSSDFNDQACRSFKAVTMEPLPDLKVLPFIQDQQDVLILDCHWSQSQARVGDEIYAHCFVKNIAEYSSGELIIYCKDHQIIARKSFFIKDVRDQLASQHANLQIPWIVSENQASKKLAYDDKVLYYFDVKIHNVENQETSMPLQIIVDLSISVSYQGIAKVPDKSAVMVNSPNKKSSLALVHNDKALAKDIIVGQLALSLAVKDSDKDYRQQLVYNKHQKIPWTQLQFKLPADLKSQATELKSVLAPLIVRFDDKPYLPAHTAAFLSAQALADLKQSCRDKPKSITVFIHGYDVEAGKFSQCIDSIEKEDFWSWMDRKVTFESDDGLRVNFSDVDADLYQEPGVLQKRFSIIKNPAEFLERYCVNGSGDCAWLLAIEHYLNKACGLDHRGYDYYQRMLGVFWPAVPGTEADYIEVTNRIRIMGQKTAVLIRQLLAANLEVNIIAHSLGCGVAMQALNQLGQDKARAQTVNHCFLWEPAVPNTIFSTRAYDLQRQKADVQLLMERDHWYVPYAKEAAKKFIILHSENDNILGPIPKEQTSGKSQFYVNAQKPFLFELVPAVLLTFLGLESVYDLAMILNVPTRDILNQACFSRVYKQWWRRYQPIRDQKGRFYPDTLEQRIAQLSDEEFIEARHCLKDRYEKNKAIIHRYIDAARKSCADTDMTGYADIEFLVDHPSLVEDFFVLDLSSSNNVANPEAIQENYQFNYSFYVKLPVLINSLFFDNQIVYPKALGYQGADMTDLTIQQLRDEGRLEQIDQTDCLFSHSGMQAPSQELFQKIYQQKIWQERQGFHFGGY